MFYQRLFIISCLLTTILFSQATKAEIDFKTFTHFAQLSSDTYIESLNNTSVEDSELSGKLNQQGQKLVHQATLPNSNVLYFLSQNDQTQSLAIRGTANLNNVIVDLSVSLQPDSQLGILLHSGFGQAARQVLQDVRPYLDPHKPLDITGHSLGGAMAVVLAMYLKTEDYPVNTVVTFGQPKVTNVTGAEKFDDLPLYRIVTQQDIVPLVPPISPLQIKNLDIFWHMGEEVILLGEHEYSVTKGIKSALRATKFTNQLPNESNLRAHQISQYLNLLEALSTKAEKKPYEMGIRLFGISID